VIDDHPDAPPELTNRDLARIFHEIGDMLELKGELVFKTVAYHRAADAIGRSPVDLVSAYREGNPPTVPGVGKAISDKIRELVTTGHMAVYDRLRAEVPPTLVEILRIPGLGPKTVRQLNAELGIETFILSGYPHLEEAHRVGELLLPLLPIAQKQRPRDTNLTGPFGEMIANDILPRTSQS
jgi:DNA polymerase (family 10)